jgi:transcriptional/translational regulatory protein YebC/TACO1
MEAKIDFVADTEVEITEFDKALKIKKMIEAFHEDEDVNTVSSNDIISDVLDREVDEFIEKNTFRS